MRTIIAATGALAIALLAGCAASPKGAREAPTVETAADYDVLWRAALDVVGRRLVISRAEKDAGLIETDYLVGALSKTGLVTNAVSSRAAAEDFLHTVRRRAAVKLGNSDENPVEVVVETGRLVRERADLTPGGTFSVGASIESAEQPGTLWVETGHDEALEKKIAAEIISLYRSRRARHAP